ncbi:ABC transporter substrate-binding protein [Devosia psychrophila]|jgi:ribose transport system substrate-binding protein|uniref:LacI family transcriptional regulator n=1 Tax=Devosia psychrophila TaxID=728005 RepID=A0A0F5PY61_9HYPH|nr:ABC transporter substrate-binding protein [Devosia psychrophila]KKC33346.1 LacI family transcriptional regulator [Devosia psychrophila]SFC21204.1 ribose transport system substrate-binding protein [Devosia psychrophila]
MLRRTLLGAISALALLSASGIASAQENYNIALISKGFQHQFWQAVKAGADKAAADLGVTVTFEGPESETQVDRQMDMLAAALSRNPDAIGFAALDSQAATPLLQQAKDAGIPIIAFDSGVDSDIPLTTATTDNVAAAALAADKMAELIGGEGKVAVVAHDQTSRTGIDRVDGFVNRMKEAYPKIEVVSVQYGGGDQLQSTEITKSILLANPDLKGIFGANEGSAIGVANGKTELGSKIVVIGFDSGAAQKGMITSGVMNGAITQNPVGIGYETVAAAVKALKGETLPPIIDTGFYYYDAATMADPAIAAVLYD